MPAETKSPEILGRRAFLKTVARAAAFLPARSFLPERKSVEPKLDPIITQALSEKEKTMEIKEVDSWEDFNRWLWARDRRHTQLFQKIKEERQTKGIYFDNPEIISEYKELRSEKDIDEVRGIIVVKKSDFDRSFAQQLNRDFIGIHPEIANMPLSRLELISFVLPYEYDLRMARMDGFKVPDKVNVDIVVMRDELLEAGTIRFKNNIDDRQTPFPGNFIGENLILFWPPDIDWVIYDTEPFVHNTDFTFVILNTETKGVDSPGWRHEQCHLEGCVDLARFSIGVDRVGVHPRGEVVDLAPLFQGWKKHNLTQCFLSLNDIMHFANSAKARITPITAAQIATARCQGIDSTMHEGSLDISLGNDFAYDISITNQEGVNQGSKKLIIFGDTLRKANYSTQGKNGFSNFDRAAFQLREADSQGLYIHVRDSYMLGMNVVQNGETFTLPIPTILGILNRIKNPKPSVEDNNGYKLEIVAADIGKVIKKFNQEHNLLKQELMIDIQVVNNSDLLNLSRGNKRGVAIAWTKLDTSEDLFIDPEYKEDLNLVWVVKKY